MIPEILLFTTLALLLTFFYFQFQFLFHFIKKKVNKKDYWFFVLLFLIVLVFSLSLKWYITNSIVSESFTYEFQAMNIRDMFGNKSIYYNFLMFGGEHELTYPILIYFSRLIYPHYIALRYLNNFLLVFDLVLLFILLDIITENAFLSFLLVSCFPLFPYILHYFYTNESEPTYLMILLTLFIYLSLILSKTSTFNSNFKKYRWHLFFTYWLMLFTRTEYIFLITPFLLLIYSMFPLKKIKPEILLSIPLFLLYYLLSEYRTLGVRVFAPIPFWNFMIYFTFILFMFKFWRFKFRKVNVVLFYFITVTAGLFMQIKYYLSPDKRYTFSYSRYPIKLIHYWFPNFVVAIKYLFSQPLLVYSSILLLFVFILYFNRIKKNLLPSMIPLSFILYLIFQYAFLEPLNIDVRFLDIALSFSVVFLAVVFKGISKKGFSTLVFSLLFVLLGLMMTFTYVHNYHTLTDFSRVVPVIEGCEHTIFFSPCSTEVISLVKQRFALPVSYRFLLDYSKQENLVAHLKNYSSLCYLTNSHLTNESRIRSVITDVSNIIYQDFYLTKIKHINISYAPEVKYFVRK